MHLTYDYDLFVIGAGSGGTRAARMAAGLGARVAIAEERHLGGTCVNVGCIPKKLFVYGSHFAEDFEDGAAYGWTTAQGRFDWPTLRDNKTREIERLNGIYQVSWRAPGPRSSANAPFLWTTTLCGSETKRSRPQTFSLPPAAKPAYRHFQATTS